MADYNVTFARSARKELESLDTTIVNRIIPKIESLARVGSTPFTNGNAQVLRSWNISN